MQQHYARITTTSLACYLLLTKQQSKLSTCRQQVIMTNKSLAMAHTGTFSTHTGHNSPKTMAYWLHQFV